MIAACLAAPNRDAIEEKARKEDAKKLKRKREEALPDAIAQLNRLNDPMAIAKRGKLMLPPPQVTDRELEEVVKASSTAVFDPAGAQATHMLTHSYEATPASAMGSMRTPRVHGKQGGDTVMEEAAAQAALLARDTPLRGGDSAAMEQLGDFGGITPRVQPTPTPNALASGATPLAAGHTGVHVPGTPSSLAGSVAGSMLSATTPCRDAFGINESGHAIDYAGLPEVARKRLERERRAAVGAQLSMLPAPQNEYTIVMPSMEDDTQDDDAGEAIEEDARDIAEREAVAEAAAIEAQLAKRSTVLRRSLPRPIIVNRQMTSVFAEGGLQPDDSLGDADGLVQSEMLKVGRRRLNSI